MASKKDQIITNILKTLPPAQRTFAKDYARLLAENKLLKHGFEQTTKRYQEMFHMFLCILLQEGRQYRLSKINYEMPLDITQYRVTEHLDAETGDQIIMLEHVTESGAS